MKNSRKGFIWPLVIIIILALIIGGIYFYSKISGKGVVESLVDKQYTYNKDLISLSKLVVSDYPDIQSNLPLEPYNGSGLIYSADYRFEKGIFGIKGFPQIKNAGVSVKDNLRSKPDIGMVNYDDHHTYNDGITFDDKYNLVNQFTLTGKALYGVQDFGMPISGILVIDTQNLQSQGNSDLVQFDFSTKSFLGLINKITGQFFVFPSADGKKGLVFYPTQPTGVYRPTSTYNIRLYDDNHKEGVEVGTITDNYGPYNSFYWADDHTLYFLSNLHGYFWKLTIK